MVGSLDCVWVAINGGGICNPELVKLGIYAPVGEEIQGRLTPGMDSMGIEDPKFGLVPEVPDGRLKPVPAVPPSVETFVSETVVSVGFGVPPVWDTAISAFFVDA
mgnify:CR=1 FL=1